MPPTSRDLTAPGFEPDAVGLPWYRRALRQGGGYTLPSVFFLAIPLSATWSRVSLGAWLIVLAVCLVIAVFYLGTSLVAHWSHGARWAWLAGLMLAVLSLSWYSGDASASAYYTAFVTVAAATIVAPQMTIDTASLMTSFGMLRSNTCTFW